jgi:hypothetical protein
MANALLNKSPHAKNVARYKRNLRKVYARATDADKKEGLAWYPTAQGGCETWARGFGLDARTVACVIAAISPQCDWTSNLRIAFELISGQTTVTGGALRANVYKARAILANRATEVTNYFKVAPKVTAFSQNLSGVRRAVTVDAHAAQAATNNLNVNTVRPAAYIVFAECYRAVADELGIDPRDFQAIVWCAWKRRYSPERKRAIKRQAKAEVS